MVTSSNISSRGIAPRTQPTNEPSQPTSTEGEYVVKKGDNLWNVARSYVEQSGAKATNQEIARAMAALKAANPKLCTPERDYGNKIFVGDRIAFPPAGTSGWSAKAPTQANRADGAAEAQAQREAANAQEAEALKQKQAALTNAIDNISKNVADKQISGEQSKALVEYYNAATEPAVFAGLSAKTKGQLAEIAKHVFPEDQSKLRQPGGTAPTGAATPAPSAQDAAILALGTQMTDAVNQLKTQGPSAALSTKIVSMLNEAGKLNPELLTSDLAQALEQGIAPQDLKGLNARPSALALKADMKAANAELAALPAEHRTPENMAKISSGVVNMLNAAANSSPELRNSRDAKALEGFVLEGDRSKLVASGAAPAATQVPASAPTPASAPATAANLASVRSELQAAFGARMTPAGITGPLSADDVKTLLSLPSVRAMGVGRFVNDVILGDSGIDFKLPGDAMDALAWELGFRTSELRETDPTRRQDAQTAAQALFNAAANTPDNQLGAQNFDRAFSAGQAGQVTMANGDVATIKGAPVASDGAAAVPTRDEAAAPAGFVQGRMATTTEAAGIEAERKLLAQMDAAGVTGPQIDKLRAKLQAYDAQH